jgi:DNA mismatch repair protein MutH
MSPTPRTDAAIIASGFQAVPYGFQEFARQLETELAAELKEEKLWRDRFASIMWSGALDKHTGADFQKWILEYRAEEIARVGELTAALGEIARLTAELSQIPARSESKSPCPATD